MEDKTFELLSKMYGEMQEGFENIRSEMNKRFNSMEKQIVRLENKTDDNHKALYDGYKQSIEGINELKKGIHSLTDCVEHQEIKLQVIKGNK